MSSLTLTVVHLKNSTTYPSISLQLTLHQLCHSVLGSNLPPETLFKLILKSRPSALSCPGPYDSSTLESLGFSQPTEKIILVTSSSEDVRKTEHLEALKQKRAAAILAAKPVTLRPTRDPNPSPFRFHHIEILPDTEFESERRQLLECLASDPAVKKVMVEHQFTVITLGELHPVAHPNILGVNINSGQAIKLRLLTDRLDGLRSFGMVRRVLCHELAHNRFSQHLNPFKELDSSINRMMLAHDRLVRASSHRLAGELGEHWQPEQDIDHHCSASTSEAAASVSSIAGHRLAHPSQEVDVVQARPADPKQAAAEAALRRATKK